MEWTGKVIIRLKGISGVAVPNKVDIYIYTSIGTSLSEQGSPML